MRLLLLPISTRRTLLYCQRLDVSTTGATKEKSLLDKATTKATAMWAGWEQKESGWKKTVVNYGNQALKRIPYEEWGLKSVPQLLKKRKEAIEAIGQRRIELAFPKGLIGEGKALDVLKTLATERQEIHQRKMIYSIVGMPLVAPLAIIPVIPNLPFFYLVYRAWSHWRALSGSKHVEFLLEKKLIQAKPSQILDELYSSVCPAEPKTQLNADEERETMVLQKPTGKLIAKALEIPELELEIDRAIWQVEKALKAQEELREEKKELDVVNNETKSGEETKK